MSTTELQKRVELLERELNDIKVELQSAQKKPHPKAWMKTVGIFKNDPVFDAIVQKGREYRESQPYPEDVEGEK